MTPSMIAPGQRVADLRRAFDQGFAAPPALAAPETVDLLAIRVAGDAYALRVSELSGVASGREVAPLPSRDVALLGIAGVRGSLVSVYGLAAVLGYGPRASSSPWLALSGRPDPIALAFEAVEGFLRVRRADVYRADPGTDPAEAPRRHVSEVVRLGSVTRRVIDTHGVILAIRANAGTPGSAKER